MNTFVRVAYIASTRNLNGSVVCKAADALPFLLATGQHVHFVPPSLRGPRQARVLSVEAYRPGAWEVTFEGLTSIDDARQVVGSYCLVAKDDVPEIMPDEVPAALEGYTVYDEAYGVLGTVSEVRQSPAQATLVVQGQTGEVLIPFVDEFIDDVDEAGQRIQARIPQSLLDLNTVIHEGDE